MQKNDMISMTQPTALFLADILEDACKPADIAEKCAAELRCLHAELERCKQVCAATSENWRTDAEKWKVQRDALLEALKKIAADHEYFSGDTLSYARATIKAAEEKQ